MSGPTYTYTPDVPQASQAFNTTQSPILNNFRAINELFSVNHVGFNNSNTGKHSFVNMQFQASDPSTGASDLDLYTKATGSPNAGEIFYRYPNDGTVNQLTPVSEAGGGGTASATSGTGWCQFPSGIIMKWGTASLSTSGNIAIVFPTGSGIPVFTTAIVYAQVTPITSATNTNFTTMVPSNAYGLTEIYVYFGNGTAQTTTFNYFVIGM